jgi:hypothetical protein
VERSLASEPQADPSSPSGCETQPALSATQPPSGCETQLPAPIAPAKPYTTKKTYKFYLADTDSEDEDWTLDLPVLR